MLTPGNLTFASVTEITTSDGVRLHYVRTGDVHVPRLVLLHGLGSDSVADDPLAAAIGARLSLARLDLRGHGGSEPLTDPARYGWFGRAARDVVELMDALGWEDATVSGGSLGAATAVATALAFPGRVRALGVCGPAIGAGLRLGNPVAVGFMDGVVEHGLVPLLEQLAAAMPEVLPAAELAQARANYRRQDDAAMRACVAALRDAQLLGSFEELRAITVPALVVGRRGDLLHPWELACEFAAHLPNARLVEDDGPEPLYLRPDAFADLLVDLAE